LGTFNPVAVGQDNVGFVKGTFFYFCCGKQGIVDIEVQSFDAGQLSFVEETDAKGGFLESAVSKGAMGKIAKVKGLIGKIIPFKGYISEHESRKGVLFRKEPFYLL